MMWPFHRHTWRVEQAEHGRLVFALGRTIGSPITQVVSQCTHCRRFQSSTVPGHWTVAQLREMAS